jgi:hypothetical protein
MPPDSGAEDRATRITHARNEAVAAAGIRGQDGLNFSLAHPNHDMNDSESG